ncbi:MAG: FecR domain-containing protein [Tannerella sp.]|jgi:ferric-dicitrate binding protein FerR (iron transport regulator)|nr:FecR domain-containing protein [Tannerella sp.]
MNALNHHPDKKYRSHTAEELLQDDFFIHSATHPTEASETFWRRQLENGDMDAESYRFARQFIASVQVRSETVREDEKEAMWKNIEARNRASRKKSRRRRRLLYLSTAAAAALLVTCSLLFLRYGAAGEEAAFTRIEDVKPPDMQVENIHLVLSGDKSVSLEGEEAEIAYREHGIEINRKTTELKKEPTGSAVAYNQLIVPRGKRSTLTLADGTQMWINASTRVVYPAAFSKNEREIYVDGEVFLDVAERDGCPFTVKTKTFSAEVLGTSFNVTAYENDDEKSLVLVSGSVKIHAGDESDILLAPSEMYTSANGSAQVQTVQTEYYTSWKSGVYQYDSAPLEMILKRLSRYYGLEIVCEPQVTALKCSGKLDLKDDLGEVLKGISLTAPVRYRYDYDTHIIIHK